MKNFTIAVPGRTGGSKLLKYEAPATTLTHIQMESGIICQSEQIKSTIKLQSQVDDYITIDDTDITFE